MCSGLEDEDHRQVGDAAAQVAPASGGGVCQANDLLRELLRAPHLARDEGSKAATDEETAGNKTAGVADEHDADNEGARQEEAEGQALAGAHHVAHGTHDEAREDGTRDRRDVAYV